MSFEDFKREALKLPYDEREELFYVLCKSLDEEKDISESKLPAEVKRRYLAIKEGKAELLDGEEVFAELRAEKPL